MFLLFQVKQYRDFIAMLPEQLAIRIFSFLVPKELLVVCQVRRKLNSSDTVVDIVVVVVVQTNFLYHFSRHSSN